VEQNKIWDYYQNEEVDSFDGSYGRLSYLLKNINIGLKVLNIGVGGGILEKIALTKQIDIYALDPSENSIKKLQELIGKDKAKIGYSQNIPYQSNYFDIVIMSEVLEHLTDEVIVKTLKEVNRVLKKNGKFIGTVPYNENLIEQIVICPKCGEKFHRWGHIQSFDEVKMIKLLERFFSNVIVLPKMFISWNILNWKGKLITILHYCFYKLKIKKSGLNLYFEGSKI